MLSKRFLNDSCTSTSLALLHPGGTRILGVLLTTDAEQDVEAVRLFGAGTSIPIHYTDCKVFRSPLSDFQRPVGKAGSGDRVAYVAHGDTHTFEISTDGR